MEGGSRKRKRASNNKLVDLLEMLELQNKNSSLQNDNSSLQKENSRLLKELTASRRKNRKLILDHRKERTACIASLAEERAAARAALDEERGAARASLAEERTAAVAALNEERALLDEERSAAMAALNEERSAAMAALNEERALLVEQRASISAIIEPLETVGGLKKITDRTALVGVVGSVLVSLMSVLMRKTKPVSRLRVICDALLQNCVFGVEATKTMLSDLYKRFYFQEQRNVFAAWKVLRSIDLSSVGGLNYNGLETLRNVEELERYQRGILPSRSSVQKASYELHDIGQQVIPFEKKQCNIGEMYQYDYERFLRFILKIFQLEAIAERESVELSITMDGAELCDGISHLTAGIKVTDGRAIDPRDGSPLCMTMDEVMGRMFQNQSRNNCFALKSLIGKDCKRAYKEFADFFLFFEHVQKYGLAASELGPRIMPMEIFSPQDLSSIWKCLNTGSGARKNGKTHFCHLCACCGDNIVRYLVGENRYLASAAFELLRVYCILTLNLIFCII
jgi:hypothetical protein